MNTTEGSPRGTIVTSVKKHTRILLILLWVFYTVNFMYCDALTLIRARGYGNAHVRIHSGWNGKNH